MSTVVVTGYRVVIPAAGKKKPQPISESFVIRAAAVEFMELARRAGQPAATLETLYGFDDAGPMAP